MFKGVNKTTEGAYEATFVIGGEVTRIGVYDTEIDAALAHDVTALATFGDFALSLNFPELTEADVLSIDFASEV